MRYAVRLAAKHTPTLSRGYLRLIRESRPGNRMNWKVLRLLYLHEIRMLLRARRTVVLAVVLPAVIMPLMLYAQKYSANRRDRLLTGITYRYTITGPLAGRVRLLLNETREGLNQDD